MTVDGNSAKVDFFNFDRSFAGPSSIRFLEGRSSNNIRKPTEQIECSDAPQLKSGAKQLALVA